MKRTIRSSVTGHSLCVIDVQREDLPKKVRKALKGHTRFYEVRNFDERGCIFFYLAKGYESAPREIMGAFPKGGFWGCYGTTLKDACEGMQRDGWMYA